MAAISVSSSSGNSGGGRRAAATTVGAALAAPAASVELACRGRRRPRRHSPWRPGAFDGRAEAAGGDRADRRAVRRVSDRRRPRAPARGRRAGCRRACAPGRRQARAGCARAPGKPPSRAAPLGDGEGQVGLDRRRGLVEVVAVERQPGLEAQRIARAEADRLHLRLGEQRARDRLGVASPARRSRSRPRRYSRSARRAQSMPSNSALVARHEDEVAGLRAMARQHRRRLRPLQREQRAVVGARAATRRPAGARAT